MSGALTGTVEEFDVHVGLGSVRLDSGDRLPFHCVAIADATRTVDVGQRVSVRLAAGHLGRREATEIEKVTARAAGTGGDGPSGGERG